MLLIDTNVVSELMKPEPSEAVLDWFRARDGRDMYLSAISEAELRAGLMMLPRGRRRDRLSARAEQVIRDAFEDRILPFDRHAAHAYGVIAEMRRDAGRPGDSVDLQIAATAMSVGATVVTRNVSDFESCGVDLSDPWTDA